MKMKVLKIDYEYYIYPNEFTKLDVFIEYINNNAKRFIKLVQLLENNCVAPYFIESDKNESYVNIMKVDKIQESEITILCKKEYDSRLSKCIAQTCSDCINYTEDSFGDNLKGHRNLLTKVNTFIAGFKFPLTCNFLHTNKTSCKLWSVFSLITFLLVSFLYSSKIYA